MTQPHTFNIRPQARERLLTVLAGQPENTFLRLSVSGGGCSGFKYELNFDSTRTDDDIDLGPGVVTDRTSMPFLLDSDLDYVTELAGDRFAVINPKAKASCGCGVSFSL